MKKVVVLLSTYNGEKYLQEQLNSLYSQEGVELHLIVRDDGSTDKTHQILDENQRQNLLTWYTGENKRPAWSFMDLVMKAPQSEYYAFCDQDDVWLPDKLKIAISKLEEFPIDKPALYYGHPRLVNENLEFIKSPKSSYDKMLDFYSSMINSNATGCTMVFNRALLELVRLKSPSYIAMHDGWFHKVCIVAGGNLYYDEDVHILYRQHGGNVIGSSNSLIKKIKQRLSSLKNKECIRSKTIASLLECYGYLMSDEEKLIAEKVANYKNGISARAKLFFDCRIKTNYFRRNVLYHIAVFFGAF
ncbi:MAG TPA: glycosyltransferase family 2 protein [Pseudobacteroides sp.]|nr:glycosyltransferase family 2 protein [Pseudobacteroides sp.]